MIRTATLLALFCLLSACAPGPRPVPTDSLPCAQPAQEEPTDGGLGGTGKDQEACADARPLE